MSDRSVVASCTLWCPSTLKPQFQSAAAVAAPHRLLTLLILLLFLGPLPGSAQSSNILTQRYDNLRTGATLGETSLNSANVNSSQFGWLYNYPANGAVYSQPLYVKGLAIPGQGTHDVLIFGTMNDQLYAYDAHSRTSTPLWTRDFTNPAAGVTAVPITNLVGSNSLNIVGNVGIESTPVISLSSNTMYLVVRTLENGSYFQRLHAVDITTGLEKAGSPVVIKATVSGTASDSSGGVLAFNPKMENQRSALALVNGVVLIAWGSHEDYQPYHGWIMGYDAATLAQVGVFCSTPNGGEGGIWQAGRGPVIDSSNNVYYEVGNGDWNGVTEFSDSLLKFSVSTTGGLTLLDWFTPADQNTLDVNDEDLGSTGPMLIPGTNLLVAGDKQGFLYLFNTGNLGHETANDSGALQELPVNGGRIKSGAVYWNSPQGPLVFLQADNDVLRSFTLNTATPLLTPNAVAGFTSPGAPGGVLSLSANGSASGHRHCLGAQRNQPRRQSRISSGHASRLQRADPG